MKSLFVFLPLFVALFTGSAQAALTSQEVPYYGSEFYNDLRTGVSGEALVDRLKTILRGGHIRTSGMDQIVNSCDGRNNCYTHTAVGYRNARVFLLGGFYLVSNGQGNYGLKDLYCQVVRTAGEFPKGSGPAPGNIPEDKVVNAEHTWPQSRFSGNFPKEVQKSDMHHLYPTDSQMNAERGNHEFGEVVKDRKKLKCNTVRLGNSAGGNLIFEPPTAHKGNVARSLFYFSIRYDLRIDAEEEAALRKWNKEDPVDEEEARRNDEIFKRQGNRNPFIDNQELADRINNF